ncbi:uncharacterized protein LOC143276381 [Babylonia areolata]|uniref:uncharacterized protein LOC143276381 n=1 Tax=Babylonia areolata TaxID=304850 RepID=UPI003FD45529
MPLCKSRCREGRYGQGCQNTCGHCGRNTTCDSETGHCQICQSGFKPPLCDTECEGGMYGTNCLQQCGLCAEGAACDRVTGHCPGQCQGDQDPPLCTKRRECEEEFYGTACSQRCGECRYLPCDEFTGHCTCPVDLILNNTPCVPCRSALVPPLCLDTTEKPEAEEKSQPWLGPSLGVGAGITGLVLIGVIVLYFLRRRRPDSTDKRGILLRLKVPEPEPVVPASRRAMSLNSLVLTRPPLFHSRSFHGYRPRSFSVPSRSFRPAPSSRSHISRFSDTATNLSDSSITSSVV